MNLIFAAMIVLGQGNERIRVPQQPPIRVMSPTESVEFLRPNLPVVRSTSFVMQDSPVGMMSLAQQASTNRRANSVTRGLYSPMAMRRISQMKFDTAAISRENPGKGRATNTLPNFKLNPAAYSAILNGDKETITHDPLDFGVVETKGYANGRSVSFYCQSAGKVTTSVKGAAFKVNVIKTNEWVEGNYGKSYEKTVEYSKSFTGKQGMQYTVYLDFDSTLSGKQAGTLTINEPTRVISVPLSGETFGKQLGVTFDSMNLSRNDILPQEMIEGVAKVNVTQNSGTSLELRVLSAPKGVTVSSEPVWVSKSGVQDIKFRIHTSQETADCESNIVSLGVYKTGKEDLLASNSASFRTARQWLEWNYKLEAGKQEIWGKLQMASTGESIWTMTAKNSSSYFADVFMTYSCFPGTGPNGAGLGFNWMGGLPAGDVDQYTVQITADFPIADFSTMKTRSLRSYLALNEGGAWAAFKQAGQGVADLFNSITADNYYESIPNNATGKCLKWLLKNKFKPVKPTSAKSWR